MKHGAYFSIHKPKNNHSNGTHQVFLGRRKFVLTSPKEKNTCGLLDAIRRKINQLFKSKQWKLIHDNSPFHRVIVVQDYLAKHSVFVFPHPPYFLYIAPCDYFFPKLKMTLWDGSVRVETYKEKRSNGRSKQALFALAKAKCGRHNLNGEGLFIVIRKR
ncbi:hypothetical protein LAZ67_2002281 [Cordylochernes scorpioides]|uniref:Transposase n=1 Tax=Cordylochernes scorpioides TaxID=51811 RepID=A0ABY6K1Z2_9ARAC|nr:hypothetical protein LAZ67_2002281 [Cordylochernes scorpioides]